MPEYRLVLDQKAKKGGGDKYKSPDDEKFVIYLPQYITRPEGEPLSEIVLTIK